jgi:threonine aldolase
MKTNRFIDLRSDTVTKPTLEMRQAMANAEVGDDMMQEDPTMNKLEKLAAEVMGKEAGLFVPSGVFGNQLAFFTHCNRGDELIISNDAHPVQHEAGANAIIAGVNLRTVTTKKQWFVWEEITDFIRFEEDLHFPATGLIEMQNSLSNGDVWPLEEMKKIYENAKKYNIPVHIDGARIFNAATYLKKDVKEIAQYGDSVMFCLSKGLCAPIGSMLVGSKDFITKARKKRKIMGGAMRQVGILAAAGIIAIEKMSKRLAEDHIKAKKLADFFASESNIFEINTDIVKTNIIYVKLKVDKSEEFEKLMNQYGIITYPKDLGLYRFVTHNDINDEEIEYVINSFKEIVQKIKH